MLSRRPKGFFITGTDTDIGKTHLCGLLARAFSKMLPVTYMKPVQTGCLRGPQGELSAPDFEMLLKGPVSQTNPYAVHVPYRFEPSCSPHLAARMANQEISFAHIKRCFTELCGQRDVITLVEGAGGVLVPLGPEGFMIDLIAYLGLPVVVVTSPHLGTINHTLLTIKALKSRGITPAGLIVNNCRNLPRDFIYSDNIDFIRQAIGSIPFYEAAFGGKPDAALEAFCRELI